MSEFLDLLSDFAFWFAFLAVPAAIFFLLSLVMPIHWYIAYFLARLDLIFTTVPEGHFKIVTRFGSLRRVILAKNNHKIDDNGDIVELQQGEAAEETLPGGLRFLGWPYIDSVYKKDMKFKKSLPNGEVKDYDVAKEDTFKAKVDYPYALVFSRCEDINNLPLQGHALLLANVTNPAKSQFATANFYEAMVDLALSSVRKCLEGFTFDEIKKKKDLDKLIWKELKKPRPEGKRSVLRELLEDYGVEVRALRIVNVDPPEEYRKISLTKWTADREKDAARAVAEKEAEETEGRVIQAVAKANGLTREELEAILKADPKLKGKTAENGGYKEDFAHARDVLKRDRAGAGLEEFRVGNIDGTPLEPVLGGLASLFGIKLKGGGKGGGKPRKGKRGKKAEDEDDDFDEEFGNA
jgi:regulator of protease activity HflC (stomatin/prohibitin superfamily)